MKYLHNQSVVMCAGLLVLAMGPAQGCIFSSSIADGGSSAPADMASALDMNTVSDLDPPPGDMSGPEPLDFSVPDLDVPFDLGGGTCQTDGDCLNMQRCIGTECVPCPPLDEVASVTCLSTSDGEPRRCGRVPTGIMGACIPETVQCEPCGDGTTCSVEEDGMSAGTCEPDGMPGQCPLSNNLCVQNAACRVVQYMCADDGFISDALCDEQPGDASALCTDASRTFVGTASSIALGSNRALVTLQSGLLDPVLYARVNAESPWVEVVLPTHDPVGVNTFLPDGMVIDNIRHKGLTATIDRDDSILAITVQLDTIQSNIPATQNAIFLYLDSDQTPQSEFVLTHVILGGDDSFATSTSLVDGHLVVGSSGDAGGRGLLSHYDLNVLGDDPVALIDTCQGPVSSMLGADVDVFNIDGRYVPVATAIDGVYVCDGMGTASMLDTGVNTNANTGPMTISASNNALLVRGSFPLGDFAKALVFTNDTFSLGGSRLYTTPSMANPNGLIAEIHAPENGTAQIVFDSPLGLDVAPRGHRLTAEGTALFDEYQSIRPLTSALPVNVLALDANVNGDVVFAVLGAGGVRSRVFFAKVPAR